jgi:hypothetical protein
LNRGGIYEKNDLDRVLRDDLLCIYHFDVSSDFRGEIGVGDRRGMCGYTTLRKLRRRLESRPNHWTSGISIRVLGGILCLWSSRDIRERLHRGECQLLSPDYTYDGDLSSVHGLYGLRMCEWYDEGGLRCFTIELRIAHQFVFGRGNYSDHNNQSISLLTRC